MATQAQLDAVNAAIEGLQTSLAGNIQRYTLPSGYEVVRPDFARTLDTLYAERRRLEQDLRRQGRRNVLGWRRSGS